MEFANVVESQEPLLYDQTQTISKLKQEASSSQTPFPTGSERPCRDTFFAFLFLANVLTIFTFGIIASSHTDTLNLDTKLRLSHFNPTTNKCDIIRQEIPEDPDSTSAFVTLTATALFASLVLTFPLSLLLVSLLRLYTRPVILLSAAIAAIMPLVICVSTFSWCLGLPEGCAVLGSRSKRILFLVGYPAWSALLAHQLRKNWMARAFDNGVQALSMATEILKEHLGLLILNPVMLMGWMLLVNGPILTFMWYAFNVGEIVPDFDAVNDPLKGCELATGSPCCREERPGWVYAYIIFASFTSFWVLWVSICLPQFVMGRAVSRWYFAPTGSSTAGYIKRSMRTGYYSSFGTICNQAMVTPSIVISMVGRLKKISDQVFKSNRQSSIFHGCFLRMSQFPECHPRFAPAFAKISGDSFWESSKKSHSLLLRTQLPLQSTTKGPYHHSAIETLVRMTFISTLLQTIMIYAALGYYSNASSLTRFAIAMLCFPLLFLWLTCLVVVSSVFTTIFMCYAMEKDLGEISKPEVCHVLLALPPSSPENGA